jgi:hypothetical protein
VLALLTTPGIAGSLAEAMARDLGAELDGLLPGAHWLVVTPPSVGLDSPAEITDVLDLARSKLLEGGADLAVLLTDLPLKLGRRPVLGHASPAHGVAFVSLPALGVVQLRSRSRRAVLWTVQALVGAAENGTLQRSVEGNAADGGRHRRRERRALPRVRQLARDMGPGGGGVLFVARVLSGNLALLSGMVRANRPWRLVLHLSRSLVAALAAAAFALATSDIWKLADRLGSVRLALLTGGSQVALTLTIIVTADLWERDREARARRQVLLFNVATTTTVLIGAAALYAILFAITFGGAVLVLPAGLLASQLSHPVGWADRVEVAWLVSSLATVGGALGAGLETDEHVREAAYANRLRGVRSSEAS